MIPSAGDGGDPTGPSDLDLMLSGDDLFHELQADLSLMDTDDLTGENDVASTSSSSSGSRARSDSLYESLMMADVMGNGGTSAAAGTTAISAPPSQVFNEIVQGREGEKGAFFDQP